MQPPDDAELLTAYAIRHSEEAFTELVGRHVALVYSAALRQVREPPLAEEVTQAVFIILARKARAVSRHATLSGWLCRVAHFVSRDALRAERRRQHREQAAARMENTSDTDWMQIAPLLDEVVAQLNDKDRSAIVLRFYQQKSFGEVGNALGVDADAAQKRVSRALEKLRIFFAKRGVSSTTVIIAGAISANSVQAAPVALAKAVAAVAVAKGAAAGGSTLTLIKGALKIMAWTKAKMAIITSTAIVLATVSTITVTSHFRHAPPAQTGRLKLPTGNVTPMIGYSFSRCAIILASDGSLWCWGEERLGWPVLGLKNTNTQNTVSLLRIGNENDWTDVAVGPYHCLAIKSDGTLWAWGGNFSYQLGDGTKTTRPTPVPSIPGNDWKKVAVSDQTSIAIKNDGTLWTWGSIWTGRSGIRGIKENTNAVQVGTSTHWQKIWAGDIQTVGLQSDGSLWFWGSMTGDGQNTNSILIPTRMSPDTNWVDACFGYFTVLAIKSDGTLWSWGREANFYTRASDTSLNAVPQQVGTEDDWQSCASSPGGFYHLLKKKDGSFWALDASEHRQVKPAAEYKPVKLRKLDLPKDIVAFTAGGDNIGVILTRDGEVWTWGRVIGELSPKDFWGPKGKPLYPKSRVIDKPWQLSNIDSAE